VANRGNSADRILFATKPLEALKPKAERDTSETNGAFLILAYDQLVTDKPQQLGYNLHNWITAVRFLAPELESVHARDVELRLFHAYRWDAQYDTSVHAIGGRATARFGDFYGGVDATGILGSTREVSEAFHLITNDPAVSQAIRQFGARAVARYDRPMWTAYLESDYASGSSDTTLHGTQFRFAEDTNVGLLLFKQIYAYQTGRSAAAGSALLQSLGAPTIPLESIATRGAFTNAFALFPQLDVRPLPTLLFRAGVLMAWAAAGVFDPIATAQRRASATYQNIVVNFNGGPPGTYYGTELDARAEWRYLEHVAFDLEGAVLFPGSALEDEDHHAVRSVLLQGRSTIFF
jgi:hypothetical protein